MKKELLLIAACLIMILVSTGSLLAAEGPIKIGIYADLSGGSAQWGNDAVKGSKFVYQRDQCRWRDYGQKD